MLRFKPVEFMVELVNLMPLNYTMLKFKPKIHNISMNFHLKYIIEPHNFLQNPIIFFTNICRSPVLFARLTVDRLNKLIIIIPLLSNINLI